jgi:hypothetical protein
MFLFDGLSLDMAGGFDQKINLLYGALRKGGASTDAKSRQKLTAFIDLYPVLLVALSRDNLVCEKYTIHPNSIPLKGVTSFEDPSLESHFRVLPIFQTAFREVSASTEFQSVQPSY